MIGYLTVPEFLLLAFFAFAFMGLVIWMIWQRLPESDAPSAKPAKSKSDKQLDDAPLLLDTPDERDEFLRRHGVGGGGTA